jgi:cytochrome c oxidase subunit 3
MAVIAAHGHGVESHGAGHMSPEKRLRVNRVGLWLFFFSESIIFGLLFTSRFFLLGTHQEHVDQFLGLVITIVLLASSVTAYTAETAMEKGNRKARAVGAAGDILPGVVSPGVGFEWSVAEPGLKLSEHHQEPQNVVFGRCSSR